MIALDIVNASNARLRELGPGLVALFVGGTSGIGEFTLKAFVQNSVSPRVYFVGRSSSAAERIIQECAVLNKDSKVEFLKADVSELKEVDRVCGEILKKEKHLNLLVQTQGNLNLRGHDLSPENIDRKFSLNYYSRMRFITNLLPLLHSATTSPPHFSRTLSVLGAGHEQSINLSDLGLAKTFTASRCAAHSIVMNDIMAEELAKKEPGTSFIHSSPGVVFTGIARELPAWARVALRVLQPLFSPFSVSQEETGARQLFHATSGMYAPLKPAEGAKIESGASGVPLREGQEVAEGSVGEIGSGAYLVNWNGDITAKGKLDGYRKQGVSKTVWEHTLGIFERVEKLNVERESANAT